MNERKAAAPLLRRRAARQTPTPMTLLSAGLSLLLAACGGGAGLPDSEERLPVAAVDRQQTAAVRDYCAIGAPLRQAASADDAGFSYQPGSPWHAGAGLMLAVSSVYAWGRTDTQGGGGFDVLRLGTPVNDYRSFDPSATLGIGAAPSQRLGMGLLVEPRFDDQAAACVKPVTVVRYRQVLLPGSGWVQLRSLGWESMQAETVPVQTLPGAALDGFEFVANYLPLEGRVFFALAKNQLADPQAAQLCHLAPGAGAWRCLRPQLRDGGDLWELTAPEARPGVYVLVSSRPEAGA